MEEWGPTHSTHLGYIPLTSIITFSGVGDGIGFGIDQCEYATTINKYVQNTGFFTR